MEPARRVGVAGGGHGFGHGGREGDDVVLHSGFDFVNAGDVEAGMGAEGFGRLGRNLAGFGKGFARRQFHLQPLGEAVFVRKDPAHFGPGVAGDHGLLLVRERFGRAFRIGDHQFGEQAAPIESLGGAQADDFGVIVALAQVAEDQGRGGGIEIIADEGTGDVVRQVAVAAHHALLDRPGIGSDFQHLDIVIRFKQQQIGAAQVMADGIRKIAEIGGNGDFDAFGAEGKSHRVSGVVRDGEAGDVDIADREAGAGLKQLKLGRPIAPIFIPCDGGRGQARKVDRDAQLAGDDLQAVDVIGMLVRDEDGGEGFRIFTDGEETLEGLFTGQSGVDQETGPPGGNEGGIAGTRRRENRNFYDGNASSELPIL